MRYVVFDVETPNYANDRMSAIGIVVVENGRIKDRFFSLVQPETHFDDFNVALTGITPRMVSSAPTFAQLWPQIRPLMDSGILVAHNAPFDMAVLGKCLRDYGVLWREQTEYLCTCRLAKCVLPQLCNHKLDTLCRYYRLELDHHQADSDALACAQLLLRMEKLTDPKAQVRQYDLCAMRTLPLPRGAKNKGGCFV